MKNNEILHIPSLEVFGDWDTLQKFLERRGNPLYSIGGDLDLRGTDIESLGNLTSVGGYLNLGLCGNLTSLGNLTSVGGDLDLRYTNIESLGNLTSVGGSLDLYRCKNLTSLGKLKSVGEFLDLSGTPISKKYSNYEIGQMVEVANSIFTFM